MKELLYAGVSLVAELHEKIMQLNNAYEMNFTDKELHFLVIGLLGMAMVFVIYPVFRYLARHHGEMAVTFIYVFTVIVVITFAIEIGQQLSGSGTMDFGDVVFGLYGFIFMFAAFVLLWGLLRWLIGLFRRNK